MPSAIITTEQMKHAMFMDGRFLSVSHSLWLCHQVPLETSKEKARQHKVCTGKQFLLVVFWVVVAC